MTNPFLLRKVFEQVTEILSGLPPSMQFHNVRHTHDVFMASTEIALAEKIPHEDLFILQMAALFHDTGYLFDYLGHEEKSKLISANFMLQEGCSEQFIDRVTETIDATKVPQNPQTAIGEILCDADLFHLASSDYPEFAARLRAEWTIHLHKEFSDEEWRIDNLKFMQHHRYFTSYGVNVLEPLKQQNITRLFLQADH